jgi:23S rRNA (uridine2552-2'-O)-methyltransferase
MSKKPTNKGSPVSKWSGKLALKEAARAAENMAAKALALKRGKPAEKTAEKSEKTSGKANVPGRQTGVKKEGNAGDIRMTQMVKTARKRTHSSTLWLQRQLNDPYVQRAKDEGWRSRAAFKIIELDERLRLFKHGQTIVDLGAAPGGWSQYAARRVGSAQGKAGIVVGIDLLPIEPLPGVTLAEMDFSTESAPDQLRALLKACGAAEKVDGVLSDMAANTVGHKATDHLRIIGLAEMAVEFAREVLKPGGFFVSKLFQGGETGQIIQALKRDFAQVRHVKPPSSRADSSEMYVVATGFRGQN